MDPIEFDALKAKLWKFMKEDIYPNEIQYRDECEAIGRSGNEWTFPPLLLELKAKAKSLGLWNLFLPVDSAEIAGYRAGGLTNRQYAEVCEIMGTSSHAEFAAQTTNCTSPDSGNMEVLARFGTAEQKRMWLKPLLEGQIRSAFAMTEPNVASSDARNISIDIRRSGGDYVINGEKWYITGAGSLHCKVMIVMGKTGSNREQSMILVPMDTPGIVLVRPMLAMGDADAPKGHMHIRFENVRVPVSNVILGEGRGFEISQARLGPGRIHHCMRAIGTAERVLTHMCQRVQSRTAFGKKLVQFDSILQDIAKSRAEIDQARMLVFRAATLMDERGNKDQKTRMLLSLMKATIPRMLQEVTDRAIQCFGAMGLSQDTVLVSAFGQARALRLADGPDEVHLRKAAQIELKLQQESPLAGLVFYSHDPQDIFRRTTDPISEFSQAQLDLASRL